VDGCLYKVHQYFLQQGSTVFEGMFTCPPPEEGTDGETDDKPIILKDVKKHEFEALLDFFYGRFVVFDPMVVSYTYDTFFCYSMPHTINNSSEKQRWFDLLSIASRYHFDKVRELAIKELDRTGHGLGPVAAIVASLKYEVPQWLLSALVNIVMLPCVIADADASKLPFEMLMCLWRSREEYQKAVNTAPPPNLLLVTPRPRPNHFSFGPPSTSVEVTRNEDLAKSTIRRMFKESQYISYLKENDPLFLSS
jgi:hypothetical protein